MIIYVCFYGGYEPTNITAGITSSNASARSTDRPILGYWSYVTAMSADYNNPPEIDIIAIRIPQTNIVDEICVYIYIHVLPKKSHSTTNTMFLPFHEIPCAKHLDKLWRIHHPEEFRQFGIVNPY